jgi:hypothetical protein
MKKTILFIIVLLGGLHVFSQELNCMVQISGGQVQTSDRTIFEILQRDVYEFMNSRQWTNYKFKQSERIECNILINVTSWDNIENFTSTIQVQSRRPVYNSSYNSVMLNHLDRDFTFKYMTGTPIEYIENTFTSNLAAVLAFYAYVIIGLDFDSYSPNGGTEFFDKAQNIVNASQNTPDKGWKSFESQRNRYWLVENLLNPTYTDMRTGIYQYHRSGLDLMADEISAARQAVTDAMTNFQKVHRQRPGLIFITMFMTAKSDELVNIFTPAPPAEKMRIVAILKNLDPANSTKYNDILTNQ